MNFDDLSAEQKEKAAACTTPQELIELAQSEGVDLSDEQLDAVAGGEDWGQCGNYTPQLTGR